MRSTLPLHYLDSSIIAQGLCLPTLDASRRGLLRRREPQECRAKALGAPVCQNGALLRVLMHNAFLDAAEKQCDGPLIEGVGYKGGSHPKVNYTR